MWVSVFRVLVRVFAIIVCLLGVWMSHHLILEHLRLPQVKDTLLDNVCIGFATSSCQAVVDSPWGTLTIGSFTMPTAQIGLLFFLFMLCWLVMVGEVSPERRWLHLLITLWTAVGLGICILLAAIMFFTLPNWCPLCTGTHIATFLILICLLLLWPARGRETTPTVIGDSCGSDTGLFDSPSDPPADTASIAEVSSPAAPWPTWRALVMVPVVALLLLAVGHVYVLDLQSDLKAKSAEWYRDYYIKQYRRYDDRWQHTLLAWSLSPQLPLVTEGEPTRGPAGAKHTIVAFSYFQCPACNRFEESLRTKVIPMSEQHGGVKVIFKHWPICKECNPHAAHTLHAEACLAARAAEAARLLGGNDGFWRMHDYLFAHSKEIKGKEEAWFVDCGRQLGFPAAEFRQAMNSDEAMARIRANIEEGQQLGVGLVRKEDVEDTRVHSTPTVLVDNRQLRTWRHAETWRRILLSPASPPPVPRTAPATSPAADAPRRSPGSAEVHP